MARNLPDTDQSFSRFGRKPEHRILWSSKTASEAVKVAPGVKGFFSRFANQNGRSFPWRATNVSSFHLLLAEVLLVQTKAEDVVAVWSQLVRKYPTPPALSRARSESLVRLLRPLGLQNQRAKSLVAISKALGRDFDGRVPRSAEALLSIPHIGLYTASAVGCFAFGKRVPIVDANVLRVLGRIHGAKPGADLRRSREIWTFAWALLPNKNCAVHNYGILDFSSKVCTAKQPRCDSCPLNQVCDFGRKRLAGIQSG
jgi:A/G-specific adenine glycosylase